MIFPWALWNKCTIKWRLCFWGSPHIFANEIFGHCERQSLAFGNTKEGNKIVRFRNDCAGVTLACEDGQQVEAHKVILAEQVLVNKSHCQHHICININNVNVRQKAAAGCWWSSQLGQILFLSGCWAAASIFLFRLLNLNQVKYFLFRLLFFRSRTVLSEYCILSSRFLCPLWYLLYRFESSLNWLLGLAPSSLGLQELASQVGSINYPLALMVSPA